MAINKLPWNPWHEVVTLRENLRSGDLPMHMFAADLYEVVMQNGNRPVDQRTHAACVGMARPLPPSRGLNNAGQAPFYNFFIARKIP